MINQQSLTVLNELLATLPKNPPPIPLKLEFYTQELQKIEHIVEPFKNATPLSMRTKNKSDLSRGWLNSLMGLVTKMGVELDEKDKGTLKPTPVKQEKFAKLFRGNLDRMTAPKPNAFDIKLLFFDQSLSYEQRLHFMQRFDLLHREKSPVYVTKTFGKQIGVFQVPWNASQKELISYLDRNRDRVAEEFLDAQTHKQ